jgi:hypothetical protein
MLDVHRQNPYAKTADTRFGRCAACGAPCLGDADALVCFCTECLEASDPCTFAAYPDGWVMLGGGD